MKLFLKRDDSGEGFPDASQIEVGELVMNSVTGKLYTKLVDGSIVEWISQKVCYSVAPSIKYLYNNVEIIDSLNNFCCAGDILLVEVSSLRPEPAQYVFELIELTENTEQQKIVLSPPQYSNYTETNETETIPLRKAIIPVNLSIDNTNNISIFKFIVSSGGRKLIEKLLNIKCFEENCFRVVS